MEKKEILKWREHLIKMFGVYHSDEMRHTDCPLCGVNLEKISDFMIEELDKARERELEWILKNCSGGGNWRRIVNQRLSKLKTKEDGK